MPRVLLKVEAAGPLTTIQDGGRPGYRRYGVPPSGPVDRLGFAAAQARVGNGRGDPALEISHGGLRLSCVEGEVGFALGGAGFISAVGLAKVNSGILRAGMTLSITQNGQGNWAYLALGGQLQTRRWLGSAATHALAQLGGGRVAAGQILEVMTPDGQATASSQNRAETPSKISEVRIILGPQERFFPDSAVNVLCCEPFAASARFDRMGMVLDGPALVPNSLDMLSEPAVRGALQVNGTGQLTMLLADHQTTGGYPKIAVVIGPDIDWVAQLSPGSPIRFVSISAGQAVAIARKNRAEKEACLASLRDGSSLAERLMNRNLVDGMVDGLTDGSADTGPSDLT